MQQIRLLSHFFSNQTLIDVFLYFLLNPGEDVYLARIVDSTGKALIQVQRALKRLVDSGLVWKTTHHKRSYYKADRHHIAFDEMLQLTIQAKIFSDMFKEDLEYLSGKVDFGFIYGSVAKGSNTPESDIDILFVGNLTYDDIGSFMFKLGQELVQEVNIIIFSSKEMSKLIAAENSFITNVLQEPKIWLFGDKSEFKEIYK